MEEQEMLNLVEYARFHGLTQDHRTVLPLFSTSSSPRNFLAQLADPEDVPHLELSPTFTTQEKLSLNRGAAALLSSMWNVGLELPQEEPSILYSQRRGKDLKVELPILRTDHELDVRGFMEIFGRQNSPDLSGENIPLEEINEEDGEGLSWPIASFDLLKISEGKLNNEKLEVSRDAVLHLQRIIRGESCIGDEFAAARGTPQYSKALGPEPITPPLLPLSPPAAPFLPSSPEGHIELLSDHGSLTEEDNRQLTETLMDQDSLTQNDEGGSPDIANEALHEVVIQPPSSDGIFEEGFPSPLRKHPLASELVVEGPLTPPRPVLSHSALAKRVSLPEMLQEVIVDVPPQAEQAESSEVEFEAFFNNTVIPMAEDAKMKLAQEQLRESDSALRVDVPLMDFSLNIPPWQTYLSSIGTPDEYGTTTLRQMRLIQDIKSTHMSDQRWPGAGRVDNDLKWAPFPVELGRVALQEAIQDDGPNERHLIGLSSTEMVDFESLTWKPEGLQILKDRDEELDDEQPSQRSSYDKQGPSPLLRKRNLNTDANCGKTSKRIKANAGAYKREQVQSSGTARQSLPELKGNLSLRGCSITAALEAFMYLRGVPPKTGSPGHPPVKSNILEAGRAIGQQSDTRERSQSPNEKNLLDLPKRASRLPITPELTPSAEPRSFIVSSALLAQSRLMRRIEEMYPKAILIERDFTLQRMPTFIQSKEVGDLSDEADLIVSPSTGVICTTIQRIKQRPLPGQSQRLSFREKIARLSQRYERLFVLISEGQIRGSSEGLYDEESRATKELNDKDRDALVELVSFAAASSDEIAIIFAEGGEDELAKWIVALMSKYSVADKTKLLEEETLVSSGGILEVMLALTVSQWEVFLRRVGVNAFAAQVILSKLSQLDGKVVGASEDFGLKGFVKMTPQRRLEEFEHLLGGRKLLEKVEAQIEKEWH
ncbi:hypothetical protein GP486_000010 [Trichoglossum hirsutum]|uniref:Uncharacterized protein n=1 Tax=Trichoglossum hirsutum TaxID=265104 RepID=A0A9P8RTY8_9PEZI|nr:hypothetical protein GP486_000010 [Trichoglossum hirsutum]